MNTTLISELELKLLQKTIRKLYENVNENVNEKDTITETEIKELVKQLESSVTKYDICATIETISYTFSILLSEVRQLKREILFSIFQARPKLAEEKSVLEKKLDSIPEYAKLKEQEEYLFNFINHLKEIKNNITWMAKDDE